MDTRLDTRYEGFESPESVLRDATMTDAQKIELLRRWEYDERELAVAVEEGMGGPEPVLLDRIARALDALGAPDHRHGAPTKQGGLAPPADPRPQ